MAAAKRRRSSPRVRRVGSIRSIRPLLVATALLCGGLNAQSSSPSYQIPRQSIDAGAGRVGSASYSIDVSLGQPDAGAIMSGASFSVRGGFQQASSDAPWTDALFADGFEHQASPD